MIDPVSSAIIIKIGERGFQPQLHQSTGPDQPYQLCFAKETIKRIGTAIRFTNNPGNELCKFLDRIIYDPAISDRLFASNIYTHSIFKGISGNLLAELPKDYLQKLKSDLLSPDPMIARRTAAVLTTVCSTVLGFPDFPTYLHCFFKFDGLSTHQVIRNIEDQIKACKNPAQVRAKVLLIETELVKVADTLKPYIGKIDTRKLITQKGFDTTIADINLALARKEKNALQVIDQNEKTLLAKKVFGLSSIPKEMPKVVSLVTEVLPFVSSSVDASPESKAKLPEFLTLARDAKLLEQLPPLMHKLCSSSFINSLCQKNIPPEVQVKLLGHLQIIASWPETDHLGVVKSLFELNNPSHKQLGIYYLLQLPDKTLSVVLADLLAGDHKTGDLKRRLDINVFKVAALFLKKDPNFKEGLADSKIDLIASKLKVGYIPSYQQDFWVE